MPANLHALHQLLASDFMSKLNDTNFFMGRLPDASQGSRDSNNHTLDSSVHAQGLQKQPLRQADQGSGQPTTQSFDGLATRQSSTKPAMRLYVRSSQDQSDQMASIMKGTEQAMLVSDRYVLNALLKRMTSDNWRAPIGG